MMPRGDAAISSVSRILPANKSTTSVMDCKNIFLFLVLVAPLNAFGGVEDLIDDLLLKELRTENDGLFSISWAFSSEGGVIKVAEMDLVGDDRKEILYTRSTQLRRRETRTWIQIYYQPEGKDDYVGLGGEILLGEFHKKEDGKSIFLKASEGKNDDTPDEPAFTETLVIQEVTPGGIKNKTIRIDGNSDTQTKEMWKSALFTGEESSIAFMNGLGFSGEMPTFRWISLKDYLEGGEWKVDHVSDWSSLNEFSIEGASWSVHTESITPSFLQIGRHVRDRLREQVRRQDEFRIPYKDIDFPEGYLSPRLALQLLLGKMGAAEKTPGTGDKTSTTSREPGHGDGQLDSENFRRPVKQRPEPAETAFPASSIRWTLVAGLIVVGLGVLRTVFRMRK